MRFQFITTLVCVLLVVSCNGTKQVASSKTIVAEDHTDLEHFNYTIQVVDKFDYVICQTTIIASKHPDNE